MKADFRWNNGFVILEKAARRYPYRKSILRKRKAVLNFRLGQCELEKGNYAEAALNLPPLPCSIPPALFQCCCAENLSLALISFILSGAITIE